MNFLDDYKREAGLQPATSLSRRGAEPGASLDPNVPTAEEELLSGEERQAAIYARLMAMGVHLECCPTSSVINSNSRSERKKNLTPGSRGVLPTLIG